MCVYVYIHTCINTTCWVHFFLFVYTWFQDWGLVLDNQLVGSSLGQVNPLVLVIIKCLTALFQTVTLWGFLPSALICLLILPLFRCYSMCRWVSVLVYKYSHSEAREGAVFSGTGVLGCCERLQMGVVDRAQGVYKSSVFSLPEPSLQACEDCLGS